MKKIILLLFILAACEGKEQIIKRGVVADAACDRSYCRVKLDNGDKISTHIGPIMKGDVLCEVSCVGCCEWGWRFCSEVFE